MSDAEHDEVQPLTIPRVVWRGLRKRCPLCGHPGVFQSFFQVKDRCPTCNYPFERLQGDWIGAVGMNTIVTFSLFFVILAVVFLMSWPQFPMKPLLIFGEPLAVLFPVWFFPISKTLWSGIDLLMRPIEPDDEIDLRYLPPSHGEQW